MGKLASSLWLAPTPSKRWCEIFWLLYSPFWIVYALGIVVPFQLYEAFSEYEYMVLCSCCALPTILLPLFFPGKADRALPLMKRYWVRANLWIAIFSFIGNYIWTHYFYRVLGARYTFPSWDLNNVPICLYLMTHAYFCFYHALSNVLLRRVSNALKGSSPFVTLFFFSMAVFILSYVTAFMETLTIANFPYYDFVDRGKMYSVGSVFYAIYFFVSFPMFLRMDESPKDAWSIRRAALDSLAAGMLVTLILDAWRLLLGPLVDPALIPDSGRANSAQTLPWLF